MRPQYTGYESIIISVIMKEIKKGRTTITNIAIQDALISRNYKVPHDEVERFVLDLGCNIVNTKCCYLIQKADMNPFDKGNRVVTYDITDAEQYVTTDLSIFIVQAMHGIPDATVEKLRDEVIRKLREKYQGIFNLTFLDQFHVEDNVPEGVNPRIFRLGRSIKILAGADLVVFVNDIINSPGCMIEYEIYKAYNIPYEIMHVSET